MQTPPARRGQSAHRVHQGFEGGVHRRPAGDGKGRWGVAVEVLLVVVGLLDVCGGVVVGGGGAFDGQVAVRNVGNIGP